MLHRIAKDLRSASFDQPERQAVHNLFLTHRFGKNWHDIAWMGETPDDLNDQRKALQSLARSGQAPFWKTISQDSGKASYHARG